MSQDRDFEEMAREQFALDGQTEDQWAYILHQIVQAHLSLLECIRSASYILDNPENHDDYLCARMFSELAKPVFMDLIDLRGRLGNILGTVGVLPSD